MKGIRYMGSLITPVPQKYVSKVLAPTYNPPTEFQSGRRSQSLRQSISACTLKWQVDRKEAGSHVRMLGEWG